MFLENSWIIIVLTALIVDLTLGEFPGKHPVQYLGDFIHWFDKEFHQNSVNRGLLLLLFLIFAVGFSAYTLQNLIFAILNIFKIPEFIGAIAIGCIASTGLASKTLKKYVEKVIFADEHEKRKNLSVIVTRNTELLDDNKVYTSLIETHSENLSDGVIAPLFYLILFGLPGIMVFKVVSTLDSMIGYKNQRYVNFGMPSAKLDDTLNYIPARITAILIWILSSKKEKWAKIIEDAKRYSSSPNAGYPVAAAAYGLGVKLGGTVYYGNTAIEKAEIGSDENIEPERAAFRFLQMHSKAELTIILAISILFILKYFAKVI